MIRSKEINMSSRGLILSAALAGLLYAGGARAQSPAVNGETIATPELVKAACDEGAVTYYTAQSDDDERAITKPFQQRFPCVSVSVISAVTGRLFERIETEFQAGKVNGDVAILTDELLVQRLIDGKRLRPWTPPAASHFPDSARLDGWWYAASGSIMIPIYNTDVIGKQDAPKSWQDLIDPKWQGKLATSPITIGGTAWAVYDFLKEKYGRDYLVKFAAQQPKLLPAYNQVVLSVARGEQGVGIVSAMNEYPLRVAQGAPIAPVYPVDGSPYTNYPMVLLAGSPHPHAAELFANWYLSNEGQTALVKQRGAYSVRADVAPAVGNPPLAQLHPWSPGRVSAQVHDALVAEVSQILGSR
jgi:iron(III) transport system substrate-binding protein